MRGGKCAGVWEKSLTPVVEPGQNESRWRAAMENLQIRAGAMMNVYLAKIILRGTKIWKAKKKERYAYYVKSN